MYQSRIRESKNRGGRKRELLEPEEGQEYAIVQDMLGNGRLRAFCADKKMRLARIRGSMRKYSGRVLIERNDLLLIAHRDFDDDTVDVIHKYNVEEVHYLMRHCILPETLIKKMQLGDDTEAKVHGDDYLVFMAEEDVVTTETTQMQGMNEMHGNAEEEEIDIDAI